mgnify:CR=1 FL=1
MISKKQAIAAAAGLVCLAGIITAFASSGHKREPSGSVVFNRAGENGQELIDIINTPVDLTEQLDKRTEYVPLEVKKAFIDGGGCARVIVHNNTDTPITAYDLEIIHFDEAGMPVGENGSFTVSGIFLQGRRDFGVDRYAGGSQGGKYIKAVIKKVLYNDGTGWENENAQAELAVERTFFDVEEFEKSIEKNADNVQKAAETPYIFINEMTMTNADEISGRRDLKLVLTNTSEKTVRDIKVAVAEFDRDNNPVDVSPQIYVGKNIRLASCKGMELGSGESRSFASSGFLESECYRINAIVTEITFADGSMWENPYATEWLMWFM